MSLYLYPEEGGDPIRYELTNKVDRSVTGKIARQQGQGQIQLPTSVPS